jgi:hypothetical protein
MLQNGALGVLGELRLSEELSKYIGAVAMSNCIRNGYVGETMFWFQIVGGLD